MKKVYFSSNLVKRCSGDLFFKTSTAIFYEIVTTNNGEFYAREVFTGTIFPIYDVNRYGGRKEVNFYSGDNSSKYFIRFPMHKSREEYVDNSISPIIPSRYQIKFFDEEIDEKEKERLYNLVPAYFIDLEKKLAKYVSENDYYKSEKQLKEKVESVDFGTDRPSDEKVCIILNFIKELEEKSGLKLDILDNFDESKLLIFINKLISTIELENQRDNGAIVDNRAIIINDVEFIKEIITGAFNNALRLNREAVFASDKVTIYDLLESVDMKTGLSSSYKKTIKLVIEETLSPKKEKDAKIKTRAL